MSRRRQRKPGGEDLLVLSPVRTAPWREVEGRVVVERPKPRRRGLLRPLAYVSYLTGVRRLRLDALGSAVWRRLDGVATVGDICQDLRAGFGDTAEPVEERVAVFLQQLRSQELVGYPGLDPDLPAA